MATSNVFSQETEFMCSAVFMFLSPGNELLNIVSKEIIICYKLFLLFSIYLLL